MPGLQQPQQREEREWPLHLPQAPRAESPPLRGSFLKNSAMRIRRWISLEDEPDPRGQYPLPHADLMRLPCPMAREMITTAIANKQHMISQAHYLPVNYHYTFQLDYPEQMRYIFWISSNKYIHAYQYEIKILCI